MSLTSSYDNIHAVTFAEGEYPPDAMVTVEVQGFDPDVWYELYSNNILTMIETNLDVYVRGNGPDINDVDEEDEDWGFAYISESYNLYGRDCNTPPSDGFINMVQWGPDFK